MLARVSSPTPPPTRSLEPPRLRRARIADVPALAALIERSARGLSRGYYSDAQIESAIRHVFGVDSRLVADGTYFVIEAAGGSVACGGWSRRRTLYGGDQRPMSTSSTAAPPGAATQRPAEDDLLDPASEPAKIRAFFVAPGWARRGLGRRLFDASVAAARSGGFDRLELMATLPGVPFYAALGFRPLERVTDRLPDGTAIEFVRMERSIREATASPEGG
jgi:N-acetylglutamate synthase-like GNAT family acetyltransferase